MIKYIDILNQKLNIINKFSSKIKIKSFNESDLIEINPIQININFKPQNPIYLKYKKYNWIFIINNNILFAFVKSLNYIIYNFTFDYYSKYINNVIIHFINIYSNQNFRIIQCHNSNISNEYKNYKFLHKVINDYYYYNKSTIKYNIKYNLRIQFNLLFKNNNKYIIKTHFCYDTIIIINDKFCNNFKLII